MFHKEIGRNKLQKYALFSLQRCKEATRLSHKRPVAFRPNFTAGLANAVCDFQNA